MANASKREVEFMRKREMIGQKWREMMMVTRSKVRRWGGGEIRITKLGRRRKGNERNEL
jgi:hypothetical protein